MAASRPWITCHVLETVSGKPAPNMHVTLTLLSPTPSPSTGTFEAVTNADGRVTAWSSLNDGDNAYSMPLESCIDHAKESLPQKEGSGNLSWSLRFKTGDFYGEGKTFWPEVELKFWTSVEEEHYHVPLLLGPWSYTTYRGS